MLRTTALVRAAVDSYFLFHVPTILCAGIVPSRLCGVAVWYHRGGRKASGLGRDNGEEGFMGYLEAKQVVEYVKKDRLGWYNIASKL